MIRIISIEKSNRSNASSDIPRALIDSVLPEKKMVGFSFE
jgi:hypothetical protein